MKVRANSTLFCPFAKCVGIDAGVVALRILIVSLRLLVHVGYVHNATELIHLTHLLFESHLREQALNTLLDRCGWVFVINLATRYCKSCNCKD